jgi:hypothetical protein
MLTGDRIRCRLANGPRGGEAMAKKTRKIREGDPLNRKPDKKHPNR